MKKIVLLINLLVLLVGCSSTNSNAPAIFESAPKESRPIDGFSDAKTAEVMTDTNEIGATENSKLVSEYNYRIETKAYDKDLQFILDKLKETKGIILSLSQNSLSYHDLPEAYFEVRVPKENLQTFLMGIKGLNVVSSNVSAEDFSGIYAENELRLKSLKTQHQRVLELLGQADDIKSLVELEARLSDLEFRIDEVSNSNKKIDYRIDYVKVQIALISIADYDTSVTEQNFLNKVGNAFLGMWNNFLLTLENLVLTLIYNLPLLIILGLIAMLIVRFAKKNHIKAHADVTITKKQDKKSSEKDQVDDIH